MADKKLEENIKAEWEFIRDEMQSESPNPENLARRELLFTLHLLLCREDYEAFWEFKKVYLAYR